MHEDRMLEIGASAARNKSAALLATVESGEEAVITRRGRAVAKLVPLAGQADHARAHAVVQRIHALRRGLTLGNDLTLKELIEQGRR